MITGLPRRPTQGPAAHLVLVTLVNTQSLGTEAVSHTEVAHQVGQVDGPDAPGQVQLLQGMFKLPIVQLAQVPEGKGQRGLLVLEAKLNQVTYTPHMRATGTAYTSNPLS